VSVIVIVDAAGTGILIVVAGLCAHLRRVLMIMVVVVVVMRCA